MQEAGLAVDRQNYDLVYTAPLDGKTTLEDIYRTFNLDRPADFTGHSLSVSDVVVLTRSGKEEAHYCDSFGFTPVPEFFLQREKQLTPRELLTGESIQTPRGSFLVTDMSREQLEPQAMVSTTNPRTASILSWATARTPLPSPPSRKAPSRPLK